MGITWDFGIKGDKAEKVKGDHNVYRALNVEKSGIYHLCRRELSLSFRKIVFKCIQKGNKTRRL